MNIQKQLLNLGHRCRPGGNYKKTSITIHSTANTKSTGQNERDWLDNPSNNRQASWHYVIDENTIIQAIPENEEAWHSGATKGNRYSLGIELCESGNREKTIETGAQFTAEKLKELGLTIYDVKKHYDWTAKICPRILIEKAYVKNNMDWNWFIKRVKYYEKGGDDMEVYNWILEVPQWGRPTVQKLLNKGYLKGNEKGELELTKAMLRIFVVNDRAGCYDKREEYL